MNDLNEWLNLLTRWFHVIAGIMWIGQTYLFHWMERVLVPPDPPQSKPNISGELWMVHGGGFYLVEKQKWPEVMPRTLHWFKWEAGLTWLSGVVLLGIVYWAGAPLLDYGSALSRAQGIAVSAGALLLAFPAYTLLWRSPLGRSELVGAAAGWALALAAAWGLSQFLSDRAVYLHVGAMFGTIMVSNVWLVIIPSQKRMMAITEAGGKPEPELAARSKRCSKHNTFMSVPLIFTMLSSHFPATTFAGEHPLAVLGALILVGFAAAKVIRDHL